MPAGRNNASALLQKVNSQLRGERVPLKTKEEDELATYLSSLTKKTQQARTLEDAGDVSLSSGAEGLKGGTVDVGTLGGDIASIKVSAAGSKFLKKKKPVEEEDSDDDINEQRGGIVIAGGRKGKASFQSGKNKMSALDKASAYDNNIKGRGATPGGVASRRTISVDSESEDSMRGSELGVRPGSADTSVGRDGPKFLKNRKSVEDDGRNSVRSPSPHMFQRSSSSDKKKKKKKKNKEEDKAKGEIVRTLGHVYLTSEEESLAEFIHGLSVSESSVKRPQNLVAKKQQKWRKKAPGSQPKLVRSTSSPVNQRSRSPSPFKRSPSPFGRPLSRSLSQDSDMMLDSMASEIIEERQPKRQSSRRGSASSDDNFKVNLMDVTSLIPSSPRQGSRKRPTSASSKKKGLSKSRSSSSFKASDKKEKEKKKKEKSKLKKSDSKSSLFENLGIHMVDELMPAGDARDSNSDSEIKTERSDDRVKANHVYSESEIVTEIGAGNNKRKPVTSSATPFRAVVAQSVSELIGNSSVVSKPKVESEPEDTDVGDDYSESFVSESRSKSTVADRRARRRDRSVSPDDQYSETSRDSRGKRRRGRNRKVVVEEKRVDVSTADLQGRLHHWNETLTGVHISGPYGLHYVDPAPVATQVVSADALEAITAYNPSMLALQDMMRTQLNLVKNFVDIQNRIYKSCLDGLSYNHQYTTLEDTKKYIEQNRKPRMTFKEALKLVEQEEGITPA